MSRFWSPIVDTLRPYTPGEQPREGGLIKLNTNENPYGPSPLALEAIRNETGNGLRLYPDPEATELRAAIAASLGLKADHIHAGNGSDEILAQAFLAFFCGKRPVVFPDITYSFYKTYCALYAVEAETVPLDETFRCDPQDYRRPCGGVLIANPNAPTGIALPLEGVEEILRQNPDAVVLVDEAYVDFGAESAAVLVPRYDNLLVVQTFSKSRSLAGLRVGFAIGQPQLIEALRRVKDSFNSYPLDRLALAGAKAAWQDRDWFERTRQRVMVDRDRTAEGLKAQGFDVLPSAANFLFAAHEGFAAERLWKGLREQGILVRHFSQDRIRNRLRISVGTTAECDALLAATGTLLNK